MELEGSLKSFNLLEILQFLSIGKLTGTLTLSKGLKEIILFIRTGKVVYSSQMTMGEKICRALIEKELIQRSRFENILLRENPEREFSVLVKSLIDENKLDKMILEDLVKLFVEDMVWEVLLWDGGNFKFNHGPVELNPVIAVEVDIESLCIEGSRRLEDCKKFLAVIPMINLVPTLKQVSPKIIDSLRQMTYEWKVLSLINGYRNVESIIEQSGSGVFETHRILAFLITSNVIDLTPPEEAYRKLETRVKGYIGADKLNVVSTQQSVENSVAKSVAGRLLQVFQPAKEKEAVQKKVSALTIFANLYNQLFDKLEAKGIFNENRDSALLFWQAILNEYPRVDLIYSINNHLYVDRFEKFINYINNERFTQNCLEEAKIALIKGIKQLYKLGSGSVGIKQMNKFIQTVVQDIKVRFENPKVDLDSVVNKIIQQ